MNRKLLPTRALPTRALPTRALPTRVLVAAALASAMTATLAMAAPPQGALPQQAPKLRSAGDIVKQAPASDWVAIAPSDLLVMTLAPDAAGKARQVIIQLLPPPFSQGWIGNMKILAASHWWDGGAVYRVQDNWVAQFGDPDEDTPQAKPLPTGLAVVPESEYVVRNSSRKTVCDRDVCRETFAPLDWWSQDFRYDPYVFEGGSGFVGFANGWPVASTHNAMWPTHCYATVGVGRNNSPDTGTGAELYAVIGTPPRQLDRNIAVVGRVIEGIEHLSSLPRAPGNGMYNDKAKNTPIQTIRLASELPQEQQPRLQYLSTASQTFRDYVSARVNRRDAFYIYAAGSADICNIPVPIRRAP